MTIRHDEQTQTALQYLTWALEAIETVGDQRAAHHARLALEALRESLYRAGDEDATSPTC
ncbi:hypothetical protein JQ615_17795 [Bradyrhizobium jicamae]|uniref:Uncharacterized protein n=1 Tax=Bradyrhizobium jicamae TaxID=280332 RepID=A0ABS5FKF3_9BRAD|nr:hypothetical protein [Bradyrhizobium jicamae]MBR0797247.1 hypothetical protein [Bradyrhizobium jicamae]MBR0938264.1 hypothetical protein [Bradyrhizobium jicamae]